MSTCPTVITPVRAATIVPSFLHSEAATRASQTPSPATLTECFRAEAPQVRDEGAHTVTGTSKESDNLRL